MTVGERIVEARKELGISQKELAEKSGIPVQTLLRYEKGDRKIPLGNFEKIADALGVKGTALMGWDEEPDMAEINADLLARFTTQELLEEIERRCGK